MSDVGSAGGLGNVVVDAGVVVDVVDELCDFTEGALVVVVLDIERTDVVVDVDVTGANNVLTVGTTDVVGDGVGAAEVVGATVVEVVVVEVEVVVVEVVVVVVVGATAT